MNVTSSGAIGQLNVKSTDAIISHASSEVDIPIKVVNPINKCESKTYMLRLQLKEIASLKCPREHRNSWGKVLLALVYSLMWDISLAPITFALLKRTTSGLN